MKKILAAICLITLVLLCTSCGKNKNISVKDYIEGLPYESEIPVPKSLTDLENLKNYELNYRIGHVFVFNNYSAKETAFFNAKTRQVLLTLESSKVYDSFVFDTSDEYYFAVVTNEEDGKKATTLYTDKGEKLAKVDKVMIKSDVTINNESFTFDKYVFIIKDGATELFSDNPFNSKLPSYDLKTENYYYDFTTGYSDIYYSLYGIFEDKTPIDVTVYDKDFNVAYYWECPNGMYVSNISLLSNDVLVAQIFTPLPEDKNRYDMMCGGVKWDVDTMLIDVTNGKEKSVKLDFVISDIVFGEEVSETVDNVALVRFIDDKMLSGEFKIVALNEKCNVEGVLFGENSVCAGVEVIGDGAYLMDGKDGNYYLLDSEANVISRVESNFNTVNSESNSTFIVKNGTVYNYKLKEVYNYEEDGKEIYASLENSIIFSGNDSDYYLLTKGSNSLKEISGIVKDYGYNYYVVSNEGKTYVYNENGETIGSPIEASYVTLYEYDGGCVLKYVIKGATVYSVLY